MFRDILLDYSLTELWLENPGFTIMQSVFIGFFLLVMDIVICVVLWYIQLGIILELGYPKRTKRKKRQGNMTEIKTHSRISQIVLWKLCKDAPQKSFFLWFAFGINLLNLIIVAVCGLSYVCVNITNGAGWSLTPLLFLPYIFLLFVAIVEYIPSILFIPSERHRYGL